MRALTAFGRSLNHPQLLLRPSRRRSALAIRYHRMEAFDAWRAAASIVWTQKHWGDLCRLRNL